MKIGFGSLAAVLALTAASIFFAPGAAQAATPPCSGWIKMQPANGDPGLVGVPSASGSTTCYQGKSGEYHAWVVRIQHSLNWCYNLDLDEDGYYGDLTAAGVKLAQPSGQKDGIYGPVTYANMKWAVQWTVTVPKTGDVTKTACLKASALKKV